MPLATQTQLNQRFQSSFPKTQTLNRQGPTHTFSLNACAAPDKIVHLVSDDALRGDQSVAEIRAGIDGAAQGECELAVAMYMRARDRWRAFAEFEQAN